MIRKISPCLWFDSQAEEAANFYIRIFKNSKITRISRYSEEGQEVHHRPAGSVMTVEFELDGVPFTALNGGPEFKFSEAVSFQIMCESQKDVDHYWDKLCEGGTPSECGWLKDKFGLSWQLVPAILPEMFRDHNSARSKRTMRAMLQMKKPDVAALQRAYEG